MGRRLKWIDQVQVREASMAAPGGASSTRGAGEDDSSYLTACVVESRSREVCIALMSTLRTHILQIYLVGDTQSYSETLDLLQNLRPTEVLLHDSFQKRPLARKIAALAASCSTGTVRCCVPVYVSRRYFDQDHGIELLRKLSVQTIDANILESYIVLASCNALLRYLEATAALRFLPKSLKIEQSYGHGGRLIIDRRTARDLELICNSKTGSQKQSLFGMINHTKTDVGARVMKSNILSPLTDLNTIETRLDLVEYLANANADDLDAVEDALTAFIDLDKMLSGIATPPIKEDDLLSAKKMIDCVMLLKTSLGALPVLVDRLQQLVQNSGSESTNDLLDAIIASLSLPVYAEITARVSEFLTESTTYSKNLKTRRLQECFAINPGISGLLDVARKTFIQSVEDVYALATQYSRTYGLEALRVNYLAARGYYLAIPSSSIPANGELPSVFIQIQTQKKQVNCSTEELISLSTRAEESASQCIILTNQVMRGDLLASIRENMDALFKAVEAIAILDMIFSFVELTLEEGNYCRPTMKSSGSLGIVQGRDPLASAFSPDPFVSNDVCITPFGNFLVVMGPNGGGKTTLLKQTALIVVMAQIGCFVPADTAVIPIRDRLLTQLFSGDDMETNLSTFMMEMRTAAYIIENATPRSLIIIDELGRGASTQDGAALAFAISEVLLSKPAFTMLVTHFHQLRSLPYANVRYIHMAARVTDQQKLKFLHKATEGPQPSELTSGYGIMMARMVGFPPVVLERAMKHKQILEQHMAVVEARRAGNDAQSRQGSEAEAVAVLRRLVMATSLDGQALRDFLQDLRGKCQEPVLRIGVPSAPGAGGPSSSSVP